ncbi:MAG: hypothetical protein KTR24_03155 [Saprospiraceae bacterium]|nr:hypothetical protein [Saprospiraceae bacterium]
MIGRNLLTLLVILAAWWPAASGQCPSSIVTITGVDPSSGEAGDEVTLMVAGANMFPATTYRAMVGLYEDFNFPQAASDTLSIEEYTVASGFDGSINFGINYTVPPGGNPESSYSLAITLVDEPTRMCSTTSQGRLFSYESTVFPVHFGNFQVSQLDDQNLLKWTTFSQQSIELFVVERSFDGMTDWSEIGTVASGGDSEVTLDYTLIDERPMIKNYYRVVAHDANGSSENTHIVFIEKKLLEDELHLIANPVDDQLHLFSKTTDPQCYRVLSLHGQVIMTGQVQAAGRQTISVRDLVPGFYLFQTSNSSKRFLRQ